MTAEGLYFSPWLSVLQARSAVKSTSGMASKSIQRPFLSVSISLRGQKRPWGIWQASGKRLLFPDYYGLQPILKAPQILETSLSPTPSRQRKVMDGAASLLPGRII